MRPAAAPAARSDTERVAEASSALRVHAQAPPRGLTPLRLRLLRMCLGDGNLPDPARLEALRRMSLREALELEDASHHRQREALLLQDAIKASAPTGG